MKFKVGETKRFFKLLKLSIWTGLFVVIQWFAFVENVIWCKRIFIFYSWFAVIIMFLVFVTAKHVKEIGEPAFKKYRLGHHFPVWLDWIVYAYHVALCVIVGYAGYGVMWLLIGIFDYTLRSWSEEKQDEPSVKESKVKG